MFATIFGKKKLTDEQLSNIFVNALITTVDDSFADVAAFINDAPEFVKYPNIAHDDSDKFLMVVLAGNMCQMPKSFTAEEEYVLKKKIIEKFAQVFNTSRDDFSKHLDTYTHLLYRVKERSNNVLYAMSKAVFAKYNLAQYQEDYFKDVKAPNPIFLRRFDEVMKNYLWSWDAYLEKYRLA